MSKCALPDPSGPFAIDEAVEGLLDPRVLPETKADFLVALHRRGETPQELAAFARAFLGKAKIPGLPDSLRPFIDVCGTGGDGLHFFNVSTAVMFAAAACGLRVAKHGNRGLTSRCGGADVLEALGIGIEHPDPGSVLERCGCVFLFAPRYHPAFKELAAARKIAAGRGSRTIFNLLGPMLNPANPEYQLTGVFAAHWITPYAEALSCLGRRRCVVVHGNGGEDEVSLGGPTHVAFAESGSLREMEWSPLQFGLEEASSGELTGGDAAENAAILLGILRGEDQGARRSMVVLNAAAALIASGRFEPGQAANAAAFAAAKLDDGSAFGVLERMKSVHP